MRGIVGWLWSMRGCFVVCSMFYMVIVGGIVGEKLEWACGVALEDLMSCEKCGIGIGTCLKLFAGDLDRSCGGRWKMEYP